MKNTKRIQLNDLAVNEQYLSGEEMAQVKGGSKTVVNDKGDTWKPTPLPTDTSGTVKPIPIKDTELFIPPKK